jgi:ribosomal-protein-alanine acetyltransferase
MAIAVQRTSVTDLETLYMIEQRCFANEAWSKKRIATFLKASGTVSLAIKIHGEIVGFIIGLVNRYDEMKIGHIVTIDVLPNYRRKGAGITLLTSVEREFKKVGVKVSYLEVREDNLAGVKLYRKAGYVEVRRLENYYSQGGHGIMLEKTLLV